MLPDQQETARPTERCFFSSVTRRYEAENWGLADPVSPHGTKLQDSSNEMKTITKLFRDGGVPRSLSVTQGSQAATPDPSVHALLQEVH